MRPSLPTTRLIRFNSSVERDIISAVSLKVSATLPAMPVQKEGRRILKSPFFRAISAVNTCAASRCPLASPPFSRVPLGVLARFVFGSGAAALARNLEERVTNSVVLFFAGREGGGVS